jgi:hypothetical protein
MRPRHRRSCLALLIAATLLVLGGCGSNSAGDVRLRASSMTTPVDDQRLIYDRPSALKYAPP